MSVARFFINKSAIDSPGFITQIYILLQGYNHKERVRLVDRIRKATNGLNVISKLEEFGCQVVEEIGKETEVKTRENAEFPTTDRGKQIKTNMDSHIDILKILSQAETKNHLEKIAGRFDFSTYSPRM